MKMNLEKGGKAFNNVQDGGPFSRICCRADEMGADCVGLWYPCECATYGCMFLAKVV